MKILRAALLVVAVISPAAGAGHAAGRETGHGPPAGDRALQAAELKLDLAYFKGYFADAGAAIVSPLSWDRSQWLGLSAILGATCAFSNEEDHIQGWLQGRRNDDTDMVSQFTRPLGSGKYALPALFALYGVGSFADSNRAKRTALLGVESIVISGVFTGAVKYLTHKHRPSPAIIDDVPWDGPGIASANLSFPSGHAACGFAVATIVANEYGEYVLVRPLAYGAAALAALSRVNDNAHWVSDIVLGAAIGHFTASAVLQKHGGSAGKGLRIVPAARDGWIGLAMTYDF